MWTILLGIFLSAKARRYSTLLYREYHPVLQRRCRKLLRDDSCIDDAMQEIFWTITRQCENYRGQPDQILPWLYRITTTHCLKLLEKEQRWTRNVALAMAEGAERYDNNVDVTGLDDRVALQALLEKLPPRPRQAVLYHYVSGMTQREIAEVMQVTRDQVRLWLAQFQKRGQAWFAHDKSEREK